MDVFISEAITEYLTLLMAGFGGGPTLVTATIHAVNRVVHEFKGMNIQEPRN